MSEPKRLRDQDEVKVAIIEALADRSEQGMTIFELRARTDIDIDTLESHLTELKQDRFIKIDESSNDQIVIKPTERALNSTQSNEPSSSLLDELRDRLPF